jgi:hypothetical protein
VLYAITTGTQDVNVPPPRGPVLLFRALLHTYWVSFIILNTVTCTGKMNQICLSFDTVLKHLFGISLSLR